MIREFLSRLIHGPEETLRRIRQRRIQVRHNTADYKEELADNYDDVGLHRRAGELREEAAELRLKAEYDIISADAPQDKGSDD